jgi:hypothetical protein
MLVAEALEVPGQQIDQTGGRPFGRLNQVYRVAFVFLGGMSGSGLQLQEKGAKGQLSDWEHTSYSTCPASRRQASRSANSGISSSVQDLKTCFRTSRVHSSSFCQKCESVMGMPCQRY